MNCTDTHLRLIERGRKKKRVSAFLATLFGLGLLIPSRTAGASEWGLSTSLLQLPSGGYHYLAFGAQAAFGDSNSPWVFQIGGTPPSASAGYSQSIYYSSLTRDFFFTTSSFAKPFLGFGLGAFMDKVNSMNGFMPSIVARGGFEFGSGSLSGSLFFEVQNGIFDPSQLTSFVIWPLSRVGGAIHVRL